MLQKKEIYVGGSDIALCADLTYMAEEAQIG